MIVCSKHQRPRILLSNLMNLPHTKSVQALPCGWNVLATTLGVYFQGFNRAGARHGLVLQIYFISNPFVQLWLNFSSFTWGGGTCCIFSSAVWWFALLTPNLKSSVPSNSVSYGLLSLVITIFLINFLTFSPFWFQSFIRRVLTLFFLFFPILLKTIKMSF